MAAIVAMFAGKKRKGPKPFADDGPPSDGEERGSGAGAGDGMEAKPGRDDAAQPDAASMYNDGFDAAISDVADIMGVSSADMPDFADALKRAITECVAQMGGDESESEEAAENEAAMPPPSREGAGGGYYGV